MECQISNLFSRKYHPIHDADEFRYVCIVVLLIFISLLAVNDVVKWNERRIT